MLPDYPVAKRLLRDNILMRAMKEEVDRGRMEIPFISTYEGNAHTTVRRDGTSEDTQMKEHGTELILKNEEIPNVGIEELIEIGQRLGRELSAQFEKSFFEKLKEVTDITGNVVDAKGQSLTPHTIFEMIERFPLTFDEEGKPQMPTLAGSAAVVVRFMNVLNQIASTPELSADFDALIQRKRQEYLERETARKLVE